MVDLSHVTGFIGAAIAVGAYCPQIYHLLTRRCSAGLSLRSFAAWLVATVLLLAHAFMIQSDVFIALEIASLLAIVVILVLGFKYRRRSCAQHEH